MKNIVYKIFSRMEGYVFALFRYFYKIDTNQICFFTFQCDFTCNPKYICEEVHKRNKEISCVWVVTDTENNVCPEYVKQVKFGSANYYKEIYKSKILVENAFNFNKRYFKKKNNQMLIQTMHGSLGIKKLSFDLNSRSKRNKRAIEDSNNTDYIISNSEFENMVYKTSFWDKTAILKLGHARNDLFFKNSMYLRKKIRDFYSLDINANIVLYAPTFKRDNYNELEIIDYDILLESLSKKFGGDWYLLERLHPRDIRNCGKKNNKVNNKKVLDGNLYADIQELMVAIDFGITDYSSWIFDYVLTKKMGMLYTPDLDQYEKNVGFYYSIYSTPFKVAKNNNEMKLYIEEFDEEEFRKKNEDFIIDKKCIDDGKASERIADFLLKNL